MTEIPGSLAAGDFSLPRRFPSLARSPSFVIPGRRPEDDGVHRFPISSILSAPMPYSSSLPPSDVPANAPERAGGDAGQRTRNVRGGAGGEGRRLSASCHMAGMLNPIPPTGQPARGFTRVSRRPSPDGVCARSPRTSRVCENAGQLHSFRSEPSHPSGPSGQVKRSAEDVREIKCSAVEAPRQTSGADRARRFLRAYPFPSSCPDQVRV